MTLSRKLTASFMGKANILLDTQLANLQNLAQDPTVVQLSLQMINADGRHSAAEQQAYRRPDIIQGVRNKADKDRWRL